MSTMVGAGSPAGGVGSLTLSWPSGHQADDVGILIIETAAAGSTLTPSGWTHVTGSPLSGTGLKVNVLWRRATSSAMASVSTGDSGDHQHGVIVAVRDVPKTGDPWASIGTSTSYNVNYATGTLTWDAGALCVACGGMSYDAATTSIFMGENIGGGASATSICDYNTNSGDGGGVYCWHTTKSTGGTITDSDIGTHGLPSTGCAFILMSFQSPSPPLAGMFWAQNC